MSLFVIRQLGNARKRAEWLVLLDEAQWARKGQAAAMGEQRPKKVVETRNLKWIARDHLQREARVRSATPHQGDGVGQIDEAVAQKYFGKQEAVVGAFDRHVLQVCANGVGRELFDDGHGIVQQRNVVAEVETNTEILGAVLLHQRDQFVRRPVLVIFNAERNLVFIQ